MMHEPPRDIPFWPDWLHDRLGPEHAKTWVVSPRLTERLRAKGYTLAITQKRYKALEAEHAAEVREAVRRRLDWRLVQEGVDYDRSTGLVDAILADPAIAIVVDHSYRRKA